jgi:hypothetical protein
MIPVISAEAAVLPAQPATTKDPVAFASVTELPWVPCPPAAFVEARKTEPPLKAPERCPFESTTAMASWKGGVSFTPVQMMFPLVRSTTSPYIVPAGSFPAMLLLNVVSGEPSAAKRRRIHPPLPEAPPATTRPLPSTATASNVEPNASSSE